MNPSHLTPDAAVRARSGRMLCLAFAVAALVACGPGPQAFPATSAAAAPTVSISAPVLIVAMPAQIEALRGAGQPLLVEFGSTACAGCRDMKPVIAAVAHSLAGKVRVADADVLQHRSLLASYGIRMIPTRVVFDHRGVEFARLHGVQDTGRLIALLEQAGAP